MDDDELMYMRLFRDQLGNGNILTSAWWEWQMIREEELACSAIIGAKICDLRAYFDAGDNPDYEFRGWFIVKMWDGISREDIAEAIKYG